MRTVAKRKFSPSVLKSHYAWSGRVCSSVLLPCFLCAGLAPPANAQLRECRGTSTEVGLKILRDAVSYDSSDASQSAIARVADRLNAKLANDVDEFHLIGGTAVVIVRCPDRRPQSKGDFDAAMTEQLDLRQVVLEVWGTVQSEDRGGTKGYLASLEYVLIPARVNELGGKPPRSVYTSEKWQKVASLPEDIQKLFSQESDLGLYTHVAVGMKSLEAKKYDQAFQFLCRGQILLSKKVGQRPDAPQSDLLKFVQDLTVITFQKARQDPNYSGWMKALGDKTPPNCREGRN
jgi:hypothetical protein